MERLLASLINKEEVSVSGCRWQGISWSPDLKNKKLKSYNPANIFNMKDMFSKFVYKEVY